MIAQKSLAARLRDAFQLALPGDAGRLAQMDQPLGIGHGYSSDVADYQRGGRETQHP